VPRFPRALILLPFQLPCLVLVVLQTKAYYRIAFESSVTFQFTFMNNFWLSLPHVLYLHAPLPTSVSAGFLRVPLVFGRPAFHRNLLGRIIAHLPPAPSSGLRRLLHLLPSVVPHPWNFPRALHRIRLQELHPLSGSHATTPAIVTRCVSCPTPLPTHNTPQFPPMYIPRRFPCHSGYLVPPRPHI